ncbi:CRISPR-associated endonuclease Cas2 [Rehaibacterium terrae]|jgi:CRISPR-associated protein Cas2|uniref:CRISPR-associated endoribonuclease Cas2 n=1 Tax=Rehaibacterium terrae TaxID=1341696 RepID=A0A7W7Y1M4_9GAMM|nr:CRISPR-associated endonuclease Cas2 [Rehaibacterium terrae]MBB5016449.1 CRISPR-associated protein Cas2 [Rehaibacterium terrae]
MDEHLYLVTYDIRDPKRWRQVFKLMKGFGEWLQLSVFQCRLSRRRHAEMLQLLDTAIAPATDALLVIDLGPADRVKPRVVALGGRFEPVQRSPVIV